MSSSKDGVYKLSFLFIIFLLFATTAESAEQWNLGVPNIFSAVNATIINLTYPNLDSVLSGGLNAYYSGLKILSVVDGYGCQSTYCIYHPWYAPSQTYAKNGTTGSIEFTGDTAINQSAQVDGAVIRFMLGRYNATNVIPKANVTFEGSISTVLYPTGNNSIFYTSTPTNRISIIGLTLDGNKSTLPLGGNVKDCINFNGGTDIVIRNNIIQNCYGWGINGANLMNPSILYNTVYNNGMSDRQGDGIYLGLARGGHISGNVVYNNYRNGIVLESGCGICGYSSGVVIFDNNVTNHSTAGIGGTGNIWLENARNNIVTNNILTGNTTQANIVLGGATYNNTVSYNKINETAWNGVGIQISDNSYDEILSYNDIWYAQSCYSIGSSATPPQNIRVSGGICGNASSNGVYFGAAKNSSIQNVFFESVGTRTDVAVTDRTRAVIRFEGVGTTDNIIIQNNDMIYDNGYALYLYGTLGNITFVNNRADGTYNYPGGSGGTLTYVQNLGQFGGYNWGRRGVAPSATYKDDIYINTSKSIPNQCQSTAAGTANWVYANNGSANC